MGRRGMRVVLASAGILPLLAAAAAGAGPGMTAATLPFGPAMPSKPLRVQVGQPVVLVNADPAVLHHPFVRAGARTLDAGDLPPGASGRIAFPEAGRFTVICAVHPHMRAGVVVE